MFPAPQNKNEGHKFLATAINSIDIEQCACVYAPRRCARHLSVNSTEFVSVRRAVICAGSTGLVEPLHPTSKLLCYTQNIVIDNNRNTINLISTSRRRLRRSESFAMKSSLRGTPVYQLAAQTARCCKLEIYTSPSSHPTHLPPSLR